MGANAYLRKTMNIADSRHALRAFLDTGAYTPPGLDEMLASAKPANVHLLTPRELEAVRLLASSGRLVKQLAADMGVSLNTFKTYYITAFKKLQVRNRAQAALRLRELGLLDPRAQ
jgi:DNA-binding NarL/FixJ family response regulator